MQGNHREPMRWGETGGEVRGSRGATAPRAALQLQAALKRLQRLLPPAGWERTERGGEGGESLCWGGAKGGEELSEHMVSAHVTPPGAGEESMKCNNAKRGSELRLPQLLAVGTQMCFKRCFLRPSARKTRHGSFADSFLDLKILDICISALF